MKKVLIIILFVISIISIENASGLRGGATAQYANQDTLVLQTRALFFEKILYYKQRNPNDSMVVAWFTKVLNYSLSLDSIVKQSELSNYLLKSVFSDSLTNRLRSYLDTAATTDSLTARLSAYVKITALTDSLNTRLANYLSLNDFQNYLDSTNTNAAFVNKRNYFTLAQYLDSIVARNKLLILRGSMNMSYRYFSSTSDSLKNDDYYVEVAAPGSILDVNLYLKSAVSSPGREYQVKATTLQGVDLRIYPIHGEKIESLALDSSYNLSVDGMSVTLKSDGAQWWVVDKYNPATSTDTNFIRAAVLSDSLTKYMKLPDSVKFVSPAFSMNTGRYYSVIQNAINRSTSGTLILVFPGNYTETLTLKNGVNVEFMDGAVVRNAGFQALIVPDSISCSIKNMELYFEVDVSAVDLRSGIAIGRNDSVNFAFKKITINLTGDGSVYDKDSTGFIYYGPYSLPVISINQLNLSRIQDAGDEAIGTLINSNAISSTGKLLECNISNINFITGGAPANIKMQTASNIWIGRVNGETSGNSLTLNSYNTQISYCKVEYPSYLDINVNSYDTSLFFIKAHGMRNITVNNKSYLNVEASIIDGIVVNDTTISILKSDSITNIEGNDLSNTTANVSVIGDAVVANDRAKQIVDAGVIRGTVTCMTDSAQYVQANTFKNVYCDRGTQYIKAFRIGTSDFSTAVTASVGTQYITSDYILGSVTVSSGGRQEVVSKTIRGTVGTTASNCFQTVTADSISAGTISLGAYAILNQTGSTQYINIKVINVDIGRFTQSPAIYNEGIQYVNADKVASSSNCIETYGNSKGYYDIKYFQLNNDSGHVIRLAGKSDNHINSVSFRTTSAYATIYLQDTSSLYAVVLDSISNGNNASAVEVRANCIANIKARVITNLGSGPYSQTVVWYGTGVLEADEIRNLADSSSAMDIQSSNFMIKGARIKSNVRGGVVAVYNFGSTVGGLILNNCQIINVNPLGNSVKSYDVTDSVIVYGMLQSTYAKASNITFLVGTETASTWVR